MNANNFSLLLDPWLLFISGEREREREKERKRKEREREINNMYFCFLKKEK